MMARSWDPIVGEGKFISLLQTAQTNSEMYPASYPIDQKGEFIGERRLEPDADQSHPTIC
jgi:hypothetical protein